MTGPQQSRNPIASSPTSADSYTYGTPSTAPTIISPEHSTSSKGKESARGNVNLTSSEQRSTQASERAHRRNIPAPIHVPSRRHLSPTADVFTPGTALDGGLFPRTPRNSNNVSNGRVGNGSSGRVGNAIGVTKIPPVSQLLAQSSPDMSPSMLRNLTQGTQAHPGVIGQPSNTTTSPHALDEGAWFNPHLFIHEGTFTIQENFARAFAVIGVNTNPGQLAAIFAPDRFKSLVHIDTRDLAQGTFTVEFSDVRDAKQAWALIATMAPRATIFKLSPTALAARHPDRVLATSDHDGELILNLLPIAGAQQYEIPVGELATYMNLFGQVLAIQSIEPYNDAAIALRVEYSDIRDSQAALDAMNGIVIHGFHVNVLAYSRNLFECASRSGHHGGDQTHHGQSYGSIHKTGYVHHRGNVHQVRTIHENTMAIPYLSHPNGGNNRVDIYRILAGNDVRTTIMLRNIPNRINQDALKAILDRTSRGDYDFMYLRIDFANNCNVGYAFINFVDPMAIVPFARARAGQRWNVFNSDKVAEISYATIQGRDCLIQKFRNSSVMLEKGSFRPKLYRIGSGPDAGTEEPFPPPDNMSKLKRSCENAAHIGLYRPAARAYLQNLAQPYPPPRNQAAGGFYTAPSSRPQAQAIANLPMTPSSSDETFPQVTPPSENRLYAPRECQAHRERAHRQRSQFDRGTPGAEFEARAHATANTPSPGGSFGFDDAGASSPFNLSGLASTLPNDVFTGGRGSAQTFHHNGRFFIPPRANPSPIFVRNTRQEPQPPRSTPGSNQNSRTTARGQSNYKLSDFLSRPFNHEN